MTTKLSNQNDYNDYNDFFDKILGIPQPTNEAQVKNVDITIFRPKNREEQDLCNLLAKTFKNYVREELGLNWNPQTGLAEGEDSKQQKPCTLHKWVRSMAYGGTWVCDKCNKHLNHTH